MIGHPRRSVFSRMTAPADEPMLSHKGRRGELHGSPSISIKSQKMLKARQNSQVGKQPILTDTTVNMG